MSERDDSPIWPRIIVVMLLGLFLAQVWFSKTNKSATYDEQVYVLSGYSYLETGEYNLKQDAPPLIPLLAGSAVKIYESLGADIVLSEQIKTKLPRIKELWLDRSFDSTQEYFLAHEFFHENNGPKLIQIARIPIGLIGVLLVLYMYRFAAVLFGPFPAIGALTLGILDPNLIGHARVVSADLGLACFFMMALYYHYRCLAEERSSNIAMLALCCALCVSVKLSGLIVFPVLLLLTSLVFVWPGSVQGETSQRETADYRRKLLSKATIAVVATVVISWLSLTALYLNWNSPYIFYVSTQLIYSNVDGEYLSYLQGEFAPRFWSYYPWAIYYKSTVSTTFLFVASLYCFRSRTPIARWFVILPIGVAMGISAFDEINIGLRRVLLVLPFMYLSTGGLFGYAWSSASSLTVWVSRSIALVGLAWAVFAAQQIYPHHLSFFNHLSGGPSQGHRYLAESNVSWGQNLPALAKYLNEQDIDEVIMGFYGGDSPRSYGINKSDLTFDSYHLYWPLREVYVMSAHYLIQYSKSGDAGSNWFETYEPDIIIDHTLYVFDFRKRKDNKRTPDASLRIARNFAKDNNLSAALFHYQNYLVANPDDRVVHLELANVAGEFKHKDLAKSHRQKADQLHDSEE